MATIRRFTRLTNAFSKKMENHAHSVAIHFMYYNFVRLHQTLKISPAMAAGVTDKLWEASDIVRMIDEYEIASNELPLNNDLQRLRDEGANITPRNLSRPHSNLGDG